jgi:uracil-DNA glycosylase
MVQADPESFLKTVRWINVLDVPETDIQATVRAVEAITSEDDAIIILGRLVAKAFALDDQKPLSVVRRDGAATIYLLPHPSGLNRWYNDATNDDAATHLVREVWREYR